MTKVVLHIGRVVVHGGDRFVSEAFADSLREEIARHIARDAGGGHVAQQLQGNAASVQHGRAASGQVQPGAPARLESAVAAQVAGRLFK